MDAKPCYQSVSGNNQRNPSVGRNGILNHNSCLSSFVVDDNQMNISPTFTVRIGFLFLRQKTLIFKHIMYQNCPETKRFKFEKLMRLYLKCMILLKVSQHALIFETQLFLKVILLMLIFETAYC